MSAAKGKKAHYARRARNQEAAAKDSKTKKEKDAHKEIARIYRSLAK